jgi:hypothetical protein
VELPGKMPKVPEKVTGKVEVPIRFFLNYCTYGYTMPWWKWPQWERFIDWMALNGVNMPLAITGQEAVWQKVWRKYGMTDDCGLIVNSSRAIIYADSTENFAKVAAQKAKEVQLQMANELAKKAAN